jgi:chromate transporter
MTDAGSGNRTSFIWPVAILTGLIAIIMASSWLAPFYPALGIAMTKVNLLAFGGGYTAVALMYSQAVTTHAWVSGSEFIDGLALSQVTPGPVIVTATFIGYKLGGAIGAIFATICVILPSAVLLIALAPQFTRLRRLKFMDPLIQGLLAAFMGMLLFVLWQVGSVAVTEPLTIVLALGSVVAILFGPNPVWIVLSSAAISVIFGR